MKKTKRIVAGVVLACLLAGGSAFATGIPVVDIVQNVQQVLHLVELVLQTAKQIEMYVEMVRQGDWYDLLMSLLAEFEEVYIDADVGSWQAKIGGLRDLMTGLSGSYTEVQGQLNDIFSLGDEVFSARRHSIELTDATVARNIKEIGKLRSKRDQRNDEAQKILTKADGQTGEDQLLQTIATAQANTLKSQNDLILLQASTNELLGVQLELYRQKVERDELTAKWVGDGMYGLAEAEVEAQMAYAELPVGSYFR